MTDRSVRPGRRAQSETVGAILLVAVVVLVVSTVGTGLLLAVDSPDTATATADVAVTTEGVTVTHTGGEPVAYEDLVLVVETEENRFAGPLDPTYLVEEETDDAFTAGERWRRSLSSLGVSADRGDRVRVRVLYRPGATNLFDGVVVVTAEPNPVIAAVEPDPSAPRPLATRAGADGADGTAVRVSVPPSEAGGGWQIENDTGANQPLSGVSGDVYLARDPVQFAAMRGIDRDRVRRLEIGLDPSGDSVALVDGTGTTADEVAYPDATTDSGWNVPVGDGEVALRNRSGGTFLVGDGPGEWRVENETAAFEDLGNEKRLIGIVHELSAPGQPVGVTEAFSGNHTTSTGVSNGGPVGGAGDWTRDGDRMTVPYTETTNDELAMYDARTDETTVPAPDGDPVVPNAIGFWGDWTGDGTVGELPVVDQNSRFRLILRNGSGDPRRYRVLDTNGDEFTVAGSADRISTVRDFTGDGSREVIFADGNDGRRLVVARIAGIDHEAGIVTLDAVQRGPVTERLGGSGDLVGDGVRDEIAFKGSSDALRYYDVRDDETRSYGRPDDDDQPVGLGGVVETERGPDVFYYVPASDQGARLKALTAPGEPQFVANDNAGRCEYDFESGTFGATDGCIGVANGRIGGALGTGDHRPLASNRVRTPVADAYAGDLAASSDAEQLLRVNLASGPESGRTLRLDLSDGTPGIDYGSATVTVVEGGGDADLTVADGTAWVDYVTAAGDGAVRLRVEGVDARSATAGDTVRMTVAAYEDRETAAFDVRSSDTVIVTRSGSVSFPEGTENVVIEEGVSASTGEFEPESGGGIELRDGASFATSSGLELDGTTVSTGQNASFDSPSIDAENGDILIGPDSTVESGEFSTEGGDVTVGTGSELVITDESSLESGRLTLQDGASVTGFEPGEAEDLAIVCNGDATINGDPCEAYTD